MLYLEKKQENDGLKFEWDQEKNLINQKKHKISLKQQHTYLKIKII